MVEAIRGYGVAAPGASAGAGRAAGRGRAGAGGFSLPGTETQAAEGLAMEGVAAAAAPSRSSFLALQDVASDAERDAAAHRRGGALLDALGEVQRGLLSGEVSRSALGRLAVLAEGESGADPALRDILDLVSLRARVEILRLGG